MSCLLCCSFVGFLALVLGIEVHLSSHTVDEKHDTDSKLKKSNCSEKNEDDEKQLETCQKENSLLKNENEQLKLQLKKSNDCSQKNEDDEKQIQTIQKLTPTTAEPEEERKSADIFEAAKDGLLSEVVYYVEQDPTSVNKPNEYFNDYTPLFYASKHGHFKIVEFLVNNGAEIDGTNVFNGTPLMSASSFGHTTIMEYLIKNGASVNHLSLHKRTPLHWAILGNRLYAVKLLIKYGADKNIVDKEGRTALEDAQVKGRTSIVEFLSNN